MLKIDLETINIREDVVSGVIFFEFDKSFPDKQWNDFIVVILNWWSTSMLNLISNKSIQEELNFMDGPFSVKITYLEEKILNMYFIKNDNILFKIDNVIIDDFIYSFTREMRSLIGKLDSLNYEDDEFNKLKKNYIMIQKLTQAL